MKVKSKSSRGDHFAGVGKAIIGIKGGEYKLTQDIKDAGGSLGGNKNKIQNE